jgi:hypothetical protein
MPNVPQSIGREKDFLKMSYLDLIKNIHKLSEGQSVSVPSFTWHTYIMLTDKVITYETMNGIYDP